MQSPATPAASPADDRFATWLDPAQSQGRVRGRQPCRPGGPIRFAFYGRISTNGYQDPASSRQWQYDTAARLTTGHGKICAEYG